MAKNHLVYACVMFIHCDRTIIVLSQCVHNTAMGYSISGGLEVRQLDVILSVSDQLIANRLTEIFDDHAATGPQKTCN